ncbi:MAG: hypothetical protein K2P53_01900, partial [Rickettsiales bacterium]|nr:hypothetical protein [Rickettsiales bacterium]
EVAGAKLIFERSIEKYKLRYTEFCGDGDSKAFSSVERVYGDTIVSKLECVGHVQKRVGTRLRKLKKERHLGGKGRLTDATIDRLQNYYGIAVRTKNQSVQEMRSAILASLFHVASSKDNNYHTYCPNGEKSWCQHNVDRKHPNQPPLYKPGLGLPRDIIELLKPIYKELSSDELLAKCMHGKTQNQNESHNMMIWERVPKTKFCSLLHLKFATYDAIANFNIGRKASVMIYEKLNMIPGKFMIDGCNRENKIRLYQSSYKNKSCVKLRRKTIRGNKKNKTDKEKQKQGTLYAAGSF